MQYILTGVVVLIISGLAINLLSLAIESLCKNVPEPHHNSLTHAGPPRPVAALG